MVFIHSTRQRQNISSALNTSRRLPGNERRCLFNIGCLSFRAYVVQLLTVLCTLFAMCGQKTSFSWNLAFGASRGGPLIWGGVSDTGGVFKFLTARVSEPRHHRLQLWRPVHSCPSYFSNFLFLRYWQHVYSMSLISGTEEVFQRWVLLPSRKSRCTQ